MTKLEVLSFLKEKEWLVKPVVVLWCLVLFSVFQFLQKSGWLNYTGQSANTRQVFAHFMGYAFLAALTPLLFWFFRHLFHRGRRPLALLALCILGMMAFIGIYSLLISAFFYVVDTEWRGYSFILLLQDVLFNFTSLSVIFYIISLMFSELYHQVFSSTSKSTGIEDMLVVKDGANLYRFKRDNVLYLVSSGNYVRIFSKDKNVLARESMGNLERRLRPEQFLRIHRSAIVNKSYVSEVQRTHTGELIVVMADSKILPVSRRRKDVKSFLTNQINPASVNL